MKILYFYIVIFFTYSYSQVIDPALAPAKKDSILIIQKITELEYFINYKVNDEEKNYPLISFDYQEELNSKLESYAQDDLPTQFVSIQIMNINKKDSCIIVDCEILLYNDFQAYDSFFEQIRLKRGESLSFIDFGELESLFLAKCYKSKSMEKKEKLVIENQQLSLSNSSFISKHAIQNPLTYQLDLNLSLNHFQKRLPFIWIKHGKESFTHKAVRVN